MLAWLVLHHEDHVTLVSLAMTQPRMSASKEVVETYANA